MESVTGTLYRARKGSKELFERAVGLLPGGVSHENRFAMLFPMTSSGRTVPERGTSMETSTSTTRWEARRSCLATRHRPW